MVYFPNGDVVAERAGPAAKWTERIEPADREPCRPPIAKLAEQASRAVPTLTDWRPTNRDV